MQTLNTKLAPPSMFKAIQEWRCLVEAGQTLWSWRRPEPSLLAGTPVLVLPGFCAGDVSTWALRRQLTRCGAESFGWGQGINRGPRPGVVERLGERLKSLASKSGQPVVIVGWSLGGLLARLVASMHPECVTQVITLGTPLTADPRATRLGSLFRLLCPGVTPTDVDRLLQQAKSVAVTSIYSRSDGVVAWQAAALAGGKVRALEVDSSHLGMACNREVLDLVVQLIAKHPTANRTRARTPVFTRPRAGLHAICA